MRRVLATALSTVLLALATLSPSMAARPAGGTPPQQGGVVTCLANSATISAPDGYRLAIPLNVSMEWDTRGTNALTEMAVAMERAAGFLESATGGQVTIGPVTILDNACGWADADIRVYAHNTAVPDATIGGIKDLPAVKGGPAGTAAAARSALAHRRLSAGSTISTGGVFPFGAIRLGRSWSDFGPRRGRWTDPGGFRTIVHELGHYAFFLYDEYFRYDNNPADPRPFEGCSTQPIDASIMYSPYEKTAFWNLPHGASLPPTCGLTRQWQVYGQPDWKVITQRYPGLIPVPAATPAPLSPCVTCPAPAASRWLIDLRTSAALNADGYLIKAGGKRALHEGVPYLSTAPLATAEPLTTTTYYPPDRLEIVGGAPGDVARVTLIDPKSGGVLQGVQRFNPSAVAASASQPLAVSTPRWYRSPIATVPLIYVAPVVSGGVLASLAITAVNPLTQTPMVVRGDTISATFFEAGRGPANAARRPQALLHWANLGSSGGEVYTGTIDLQAQSPRTGRLAAPILDGTLYLTPSTVRHEDPSRPAGGAWATASVSIACNSPSLYASGHAPGDEGGLDSADGVVNVDLVGSGVAGLCLGIAAQASPPGLGRAALGNAFTIAASGPLPAVRAAATTPTTATVTMHVDADAAQALQPTFPVTTVLSLTRVSLPVLHGPRSGTAFVARPATLAACPDPLDGTVATLESAQMLDGIYQATVTKATAVPSLTRLACPSYLSLTLLPLLGSWVNVNPRTRSIPRIDIWSTSSGVYAHTYGACVPTDCDWGSVRVMGAAPPGRATYTFSFAVKRQTIDRDGPYLRVVTNTHFTDNSGRRDFSTVDYFRNALTSALARDQAG